MKRKKEPRWKAYSWLWQHCDGVKFIIGGRLRIGHCKKLFPCTQLGCNSSSLSLKKCSSLTSNMGFLVEHIQVITVPFLMLTQRLRALICSITLDQHKHLGGWGFTKVSLVGMMLLLMKGKSLRQQKEVKMNLESEISEKRSTYLCSDTGNACMFTYKWTKLSWFLKYLQVCSLLWSL